MRALEGKVAIVTGAGQGVGEGVAVALAAAGASQRQIAAELGVHPTTIGRWLSAPDHPAEGEAR